MVKMCPKPHLLSPVKKCLRDVTIIQQPVSFLSHAAPLSSWPLGHTHLGREYVDARECFHETTSLRTSGNEFLSPSPPVRCHVEFCYTDFLQNYCLVGSRPKRRHAFSRKMPSSSEVTLSREGMTIWGRSEGAMGPAATLDTVLISCSSKPASGALVLPAHFPGSVYLHTHTSESSSWPCVPPLRSPGPITLHPLPFTLSLLDCSLHPQPFTGRSSSHQTGQPAGQLACFERWISSVYSSPCS